MSQIGVTKAHLCKGSCDKCGQYIAEDKDAKWILNWLERFEERQKTIMDFIIEYTRRKK